MGIDKKLKLAIKIVCGETPPSIDGGIDALRHLRDRTMYLLREAEIAIAARAPKPRRMKFSPAVVARRQERREAVNLALSVYDKVVYRGRAIGDMWYTELENMRSEGVLWATLADQLMRHSYPTAPTRIRDMVSERELTTMYDKAKRAALAVDKDRVGDEPLTLSTL